MAEKSPSDLSVIIPLFNEESNFQELISRLSKSASVLSEDFELIFINDGSTDNSLQLIQQASAEDDRIKYISLSRNFGHQVAVSAGLNNCNGSAIVIIDGDLQDPPELIPDLYSKYKDGYDVVYAKRTIRKGDGILKRMTARLFYRILKKITSFDIPLDTGDFRLIDRKIADLLKCMPEQNKFLRGQIAWLGFKQTYVEFERQERKGGKTGYSFTKMVSFALDGITAFSNKPLVFVRNMGIIISFLAFALILYTLISYFFLGNTITGWTSLIVSIAFLGGIQLISIGIIGEYLSRINSDVRNRPLYIIDKSNLPDCN